MSTLESGGRFMRSLTVVCMPSDGHPAEELVTESNLTREQLYHTTVMADGTMILLGRLRGDLNQARRVFEAEDDVLGYNISGGAEGSGLAYVHARPPPGIREFLTLQREHEVFFDFPIDSTSRGGMRVDMIGESNEVLQEALADIPDEMEVTIERIGRYPESTVGAAVRLTDRQREILNVALDLGYYEVPRRATHEDIAEQMKLTVGTVSEHLQKIEARVFESFKQDSEDTPNSHERR